MQGAPKEAFAKIPPCLTMLHDAGVWFEHRAVLAVHEANGVQRQEEAVLLFSFYHLAAGPRKKKKKNQDICRLFPKCLLQKRQGICSSGLKA